MAKVTPKNRSSSRILGPVGSGGQALEEGQWWVLGAESRVQVQEPGQQEAETLMAREGIWGGGGVGTSLVDTVEGISHRPAQEGDAGNCSNMKEWGCGLWTRAGEEGSFLQHLPPFLLGPELWS